MGKDPNQVSMLLVEGDKTLTDRWQKGLDDQGLDTVICTQAGLALDLAEQSYFDLVVLPERVDGQETDELLLRLTELFPETLVLVTSEQPMVDRAVQAMRLGAFDYLPKPTTSGGLLGVLDEALSFRELRHQQGEQHRRLTQKYDVHNIVGKSQPMQDVFRLIHKVAAADATVLITGESGTGKELVARAIHYHSPRQNGLLVPVNCGAIPGELLESELFGHEKGAFTGAIKTRQGRFELAEGGTIFLDEIGDMSPMLQVKLLRVLQDHQFERVGSTRTINADIRIIAATNQDLSAKVGASEFREDLFYRLNVVPIEVPPLRDRRSDIPMLCGHFMSRLSQQKGLEPKSLHPEVKDRLMRYAWPGNVRELENLLERMVILADEDEIRIDDLPPHLAGPLPELPPDQMAQAGPSPLVPEDGLNFNQTVDAFERELICQALDRTGWIKNQAATLLQLNRTTLVEKIKKKGITKEES